MRYKLPFYLSMLFGAFGVIVPFLIYGKFEDEISQFGYMPETGILFNVSIALSGAFFFLYALTFARDHYKKIGKITSACFLFLAIGQYMMGTFPIGGDPFIWSLHRIGAAFIFLGFAILMIWMGNKFKDIHQKFSYISISWGLISLTCIIYIILFDGYSYYFQLLSIIIISAWNFLLIYLFEDLAGR